MSITINDSLQNNSPKHLDAKYMKFSAGVCQPWASVSEAQSSILLSYRYQFLTILCLMNSDPVEFWWRAGTADLNLEPKSKESYTLNSSGSVQLTAGYLYNKIVILPTATTTSLLIGTTNGGNDIEPGVNIASGDTYTLDFPFYTGAATTIYFTNVASGTKILLFKTF